MKTICVSANLERRADDSELTLSVQGSESWFSITGARLIEVTTVSSVFLEKTVQYYREKLAAHGPGAQGMDWKDQETQYLRFEVIARYIDFRSNPTVLDVGCGSGEFLTYCQTHELSLRYQGIDVCPEMVAACQSRHGMASAREATVDDLVNQEESFDYVIASGTFNAKMEIEEKQWRKYFHDSMKSMFRLSRVAAVVNMMTCYVDYRYDRLYYASPSEIGEFAVKNLSPDFIIDHSYALYEMTAVFSRSQESR